MKKLVASINSPGQLTVMAALLAGLCASAATSAAVMSTIPTHLVISQVYGGGGNSGAPLAYDFVELFNPTSATVNLAGMSVQYTSKTGTAWKGIALSGTLAPGQYYLVQEAKGAGNQGTFPTPDMTDTQAMSATDGKVALSNGTAALSGLVPPASAVIDMVAYGASTALEGAPAPGLGNTLAARRLNECTDTDNNAADFGTFAPAPRNRATDLNRCDGNRAIKLVSCPASMTIQDGYNGATTLVASDLDGIVSDAVIGGDGSAVGISLVNVVKANANGESMSADLKVPAGTAPGVYPVSVTFSNSDSQSATCAVSVKVPALVPVTAAIYEIQGALPKSGMVDTEQTTEGVITAKVGNGFFIQSLVGDGNPHTSDGIYVFAPTVAAVGDVVRVTGKVAEFTPAGASRSVTELTNASAILVLESGRSVPPTPISYGSNLADVEGMLVTFSDTLVVNQSEYLADRGELTLGQTRHEVPTNRYPARSAEAQALAAANAADILVLDDGLFVTPPVIPYIGEDGTVRVGDSVTNLTGVIDYGIKGGSGAVFKLQPTVAPTFSRSNPRTGAPVLPVGNVKVASANVLNFFTTFTNGSDVDHPLATNLGCHIGVKNGGSTSKGNCRGADSLAEFERQRDKIVNELKALDADVVGLMEIQNNDEVAVTYLVNQLNGQVGVGTYAVVPMPADTGTDAIRVAMIYKPSKLSLAGGALSDGDAINNRPPMAQTFKLANGAKFSVIVNHFKSKGSCGTGADGDLGDSQGCWNATRIQQANRLSGYFIPVVTAAAGDPDVLVIGDLNSHGFEDPIVALTNTGMVNQLERFLRKPGSMPYSYVFDGETGYLDHALASASLSPQVIGAAEWHNNADEPPAIDYNLDGKPNDLYVNNAYRASDHDPVVVSLSLPATFTTLPASSFSVYRSGLLMSRTSPGQYSGTVVLTNQSGAAISGPFQVEFSGLPAGVTMLNTNGTHNGSPYITASATSLAPGASMTIPVTFNNPSRAAIPYTPIISTGTF